MSTELASDSGGYHIVESEPPELLARNLRVAGYLWSTTTVFFFVGFLFAFFYLRSLNNADLWRPKGVDPPVGFGTAILVVILASVALGRLALRERRLADDVMPANQARLLGPRDQARLRAWRLRGSIALGLGLATVVLQCVEWATMGFGPASGGYASVFVGWTGLLALFALGAMFWLETLLATSFRYRRATTVAAGEAAGDPYRTGHDIEDPLALVLPSLEAFSIFWAVVAGVEVVSYVLLYLVR
jgi:heme/copper-type cytochrome/quinol oxidase subunit 3